MSIKKHYKIIGTYDGGLCVELETVEPISAADFASVIAEHFEEYKISDRRVTRLSLREELHGEFEIGNLAGPMYGGELDGVPVVRYETREAYERLSA